MTIAAKISSAEVEAQISGRFVDKYLEARLINAPGVTYTPGTTNDATFLSNEVVLGFGGYQRKIIGYATGDLTAYSDSGVGLASKATVFAHDGTADVIAFSHVALVWSIGNVITMTSPASAPSAGVDGTYTNIPIDSTSGGGVGLVVDLTIQNSGAATTDYILTVKEAGYGYNATDVITINDGTLAGVGAIAPGAGSIGATVASVSNQPNAGDVMSVAQTTSTVNLAAGNEAVFYWNLKQYGLSSVV